MVIKCKNELGSGHGLVDGVVDPPLVNQVLKLLKSFLSRLGTREVVVVNLDAVLIVPVTLKIILLSIELFMRDDPSSLVILVWLDGPLSDSELHTTVVVKVIENGDGVTLFSLSAVTEEPLLLLLVFGDLIRVTRVKALISTVGAVDRVKQVYGVSSKLLKPLNIMDVINGLIIIQEPLGVLFIISFFVPLKI